MITRRKFLQMSLVAVPYTTIGTANARAAYFSMSPVRWALSFAIGVGSSIAADTIQQYFLKYRTNSSLRNSVTNTNRAMENAGFDDFREAQVFRQGGYGQIYYPVMSRSSADDICMPFYNEANGTPTTILESPTAYGLAFTAMSLHNRGRSQSRLADQLVPLREIEKGSGDLRTGYGSSNILQTRAGCVIVDYDVMPEKREGLITVRLVDQQGNEEPHRLSIRT